MQSTIKIILLLLLVCYCSSCKKFLAEKTDKKLVVPATLKDATTLMDDYDALANFYPDMPFTGDDDLFFTDSYFGSMSIANQSNYRWDKDAHNDFEWNYDYQAVLKTNTVLQTLENVPITVANESEWKRVKGAALVFRAYSFYMTAQSYTTPYQKSTAAQQLGIPLRLDPDINKPSVRSTLEETYAQIIADLKQATDLLPVQAGIVSRPNKAAAFAALARVYLTMNDYALAKASADSCFGYYNTLIDYNTLNATASYPFAIFNSEVLLPSTEYISITLSEYKIDSLLYQSYNPNDLRKSVFFSPTAGGTYTCKGSYNGDPRPFSGIATDEIYLIRAECNARSGNKDAALADLNALLIKRFKTGTFVPFTATDANDALVKILTERRKELIQRGTRWTDLRRLNLDPQFAKTLTRKINGQTYTLPPNDPRYTHYLPLAVIAQTGMQQNVR
jgi:hypothetical protein